MIRDSVFRAAALVLIWCLIAAASPAFAGKRPERFSNKKELRGTIWVKVGKTFTEKDEDNTSVSKTSLDHMVQLDVVFPLEPKFIQEHFGMVALRGHVEHLRAGVQDVKTVKSTNPEETSVFKITCNGSEDIRFPGGGGDSENVKHGWDGSVSLAVDTKSKTYQFSFNSVCVQGRVRQGDDESSDPSNVVIPGFEVGPLPLPPTEDEPLSGQKAFGIYRDPMASRDPNDLMLPPIIPNSIPGIEWPKDLVANVRWSFGQPAETEVSVEVDGSFDSWLPEGNLEHPSDAGNKLKLRAWTHDPGKPEATSKSKVRLSFSLNDVSSEKGVCMNWPIRDPSSESDLQIEINENPTLSVLGKVNAETRDLVNQADLVISCFDYGAWGTLKVTAKDKDGKAVKVLIRKKETSELKIPVDENKNHVADGWEKKETGALYSAKYDEDSEPKGDGHTGDALGLYDEYRGFSIQFGHVRTSPRKKDIFILNKTGFPLDIFKKSKLTVHMVTSAEAGAGGDGFNKLVINPNRGANSLEWQYVILLQMNGSLGKTTQGVGRMQNGEPGPPKNCRSVDINPNLDDDGKARIGTLLAHELGHACCVLHHGDNHVVVAKVLTDRRLADSEAEDAPDETFLVDPVKGGSESSGDLGCVMCYDPPAFLVIPDPGDLAKGLWLYDANGRRYLGSAQPLKNFFKGEKKLEGQDCYCTGDGGNAARKNPSGLAAPGRGNCMGQFCVNHFKH